MQKKKKFSKNMQMQPKKKKMQQKQQSESQLKMTDCSAWQHFPPEQIGQLIDWQMGGLMASKCSLGKKFNLKVRTT